MALKTDYKADVFEGNRKYQISTDAQGKSEILDVTVYSQDGDLFRPEDINATNKAINGLKNDKVITIPAFTQTAAPYTVDIEVEHLKTTDAIELFVGLHQWDEGMSVSEKAEKLKMRRKSLAMIDDAACNIDGILTVTAYSKKPSTDFAVWLRGCSTE